MAKEIIPSEIMGSTHRYKLLKRWVAECIANNPEILQASKSHIDVYLKLYEIWVIDCQKAMKEIISDIGI